MCEFISWVEKRGKVYFLTGDQLFKTRKGRELLKTISPDDYCGHGTIRAYYGIDAGDGVDKECVDFSSPDNFPDKIVEAIKQGEMRGIRGNAGLLSKSARVEYNKICEPARAEYNKICQAAWAEYDKICRPARDEHDKICQAAWAEYDKIRQAAFWDLFAIPENRNPNWN